MIFAVILLNYAMHQILAFQVGLNLCEISQVGSNLCEMEGQPHLCLSEIGNRDGI